MSGNITNVNSDVNAWGQELVDTGSLFNFAKLDLLGTPQALAESLIKLNLLTSVGAELDAQGIDVFSLKNAINGDPALVLTPLTQKRCYDAFAQVTGDNLEQILSVMEVPPVLAKSNYAFTLSLGQIKGVLETTPQLLGAQASSIEGNAGLTNTGSLTDAVPPATIAGIKSELEGGSGPDGTFYLTDIIGAAAAEPYASNIATMNTVIDTDGNGDRL